MLPNVFLWVPLFRLLLRLQQLIFICKPSYWALHFVNYLFVHFALFWQYLQLYFQLFWIPNFRSLSFYCTSQVTRLSLLWLLPWHYSVLFLWIVIERLMFVFFKLIKLFSQKLILLFEFFVFENNWIEPFIKIGWGKGFILSGPDFNASMMVGFQLQ